MIELKETNHNYYCESYTSEYLQIYNNWNEFEEKWKIKDLDYSLNYLVRFDLKKDKNTYYLKLFYIQQRKGIFIPVIIKNILEKDLISINEYLINSFNYIKEIWKEVK